MHKSDCAPKKRPHHLLSFKSLFNSPQIISISGLQLVSHQLCITSQSLQFCFGILFYSLKQQTAMLLVNFWSMTSSDFQTHNKTRHVQTWHQFSIPNFCIQFPNFHNCLTSTNRTFIVCDSIPRVITESNSWEQHHMPQMPVSWNVQIYEHNGNILFNLRSHTMIIDNFSTDL